MKQFSKDLGNVCLAPKGKWNKEQEYERLALVYNASNNLSYVAKINVPIGVEIDNREYWQPMNATGYSDNNFINLTAENENGTITAYESLEEAVATIFPINRRVGATLSFYNLNSDRLDRQAEFELWQFNSTDLANWENKYYWNNIYYNWNVFTGWYIDADTLKNHVETPNVGQYAYVGSNLNDALLYQCRTNGTWTNTGIKVRNYISVVVSGNITIGENGNWFSDGEDTGIPATPAVDEQIDNIITKHESLSRTVQGIAATGGASTATNVTYDNNNSRLNAENAQDAIDELQGSKFDKENVVQELGTSKDKIVSQNTVSKYLISKNHRYANKDGSITIGGINTVNITNLIDIRIDGSFTVENIFNSRPDIAISYIILSETFDFLGFESVDSSTYIIETKAIKTKFQKAAYIVINSTDHSKLVELDENNLWRDTKISYIAIYQLMQNLSSLKTELQKKSDKKIDILGDSWTQLETSSHVGWQYTWANILINEGYDVNCVARSGAGFVNTTQYPSLFNNQIPKLRDNADIIAVFVGVNDYSRSITMGSAEESFLIDYNSLDTENSNTTTICNAAYKTLYTLRKKYQTKKIYFMATGANQFGDSGTSRQKEYVENMHKICKRLGIQYIDCFDNALPSYSLSDKDTWWWHQGPHPSNEGQKLFSEIWKSIMNI